MHVVMFVILAPYDNEQSDLIHRINQDANLIKLMLYKYDESVKTILYFTENLSNVLLPMS